MVNIDHFRKVNGRHCRASRNIGATHQEKMTSCPAARERKLDWRDDLPDDFTIDFEGPNIRELKWLTQNALCF
jgi:hypothetical protein